VTLDLPTHPVVDCAVRVEWASQEEVTEHLDAGWREYIGRPGSLKGGVGGKNVNLSIGFHHPDGDYVVGGAEACTQPEQLSKEVLRGNTVAAVLVPAKAMLTPADNNALWTVQLARAINNWMADRWLKVDSRFRGSIVVPNQLPSEAAAEIRRLASDSRFAQVLMVGNGLGKPFGHPVYHPIYEAAAEAALPVSIHLGGDAVPDTLTHPTAGGLPSTYSEYRVVGTQSLMAHVVSLIGQGVFERYPRLKVIIVGGGLMWIPALIWRMDNNFGPFGREAPWLRRKPSAYFRDHFLVAAQPLERPREIARLHRALSAFQGMEHLVCFASAYPERDMETPSRIAAALPKDWHRLIFYENAASTYGDRLTA
jgi:hypothetical protein